MTRSVRNAKIETRSARAKCEKRREPYWAKLSTGCFVGYRRAAGGIGTWIARYRDGKGRQRYEALGPADDAKDADGQKVLNFNQAQEKARRYFERVAREIDGHEPLARGPTPSTRPLATIWLAASARDQRAFPMTNEPPRRASCRRSGNSTWQS